MNEEIQFAVHNGDRDAFRSLYNQYAPQVYQRAFLTLGTREDALALVKKVFSQVYRALRHSSTPLDLEGYIDYLARQELLLTPESRTSSTNGSNKSAYPAQNVERAAFSPQYAPSEPCTLAEPAINQVEQPINHYPRPTPDTMEESEGNQELIDEELRGPGFANIVLTTVLILFLLFFLWVLTGILMDFGVFPAKDLLGSYSWFNANLFQLFDFA